MDPATAMEPPPLPLEPSAAGRPEHRPRRSGAFSGKLAVDAAGARSALTTAPADARVDARACLPDFEEWWADEESRPRARPSVSTNRLSGPVDVGQGYAVEPPFRVTQDELDEIRYSRRLPTWRLEARESRLRPPRWLFVPERRENPIQRLGACRCPAQGARPDFVRFCLRHLGKLAGSEGLVYATLGSGELYHDFDVLEGLRADGVRLASVHSVDVAYKRSISEVGRNARSALQTLAAWLATDGVRLVAYDGIDALEEAIGPSAHVLMHSDAPACTGGLARLRRTLRPGALYLHMAQGTGSAFEAWRHSPRGTEESEEEGHVGGLELLERASWPVEGGP